MTGLTDHLPDALRRRLDGQTLQEIADVYGYSAGYVHLVTAAKMPIQWSGKNHTSKRHDPSLIREARKLWNRGLTTREIAEALSTEERPLTRCSIIGISHRNGFAYRNPPK